MIDFPNGRWGNHTVKSKDDWVSQSIEAHIAQQIGYETNRTLQNLNVDINGHVGQIKKRFYHNPDCRNAFSNYFCWINFPRCDPTRDLTLPTCRSACHNFFKACRYERKLKRCGKSKYFNGYSPEDPQSDGSYLREYFPGQPFRSNKFTQGGQEEPICTPALTGAAASNFLCGNHIIICSILICLSIAVSLVLLVF
jgi:hypothetical protein